MFYALEIVSNHWVVDDYYHQSLPALSMTCSDLRKKFVSYIHDLWKRDTFEILTKWRDSRKMIKIIELWCSIPSNSDYHFELFQRTIKKMCIMVKSFDQIMNNHGNMSQLKLGHTEHLMKLITTLSPILEEEKRVVNRDLLQCIDSLHITQEKDYIMSVMMFIFDYPTKENYLKLYKLIDQSFLNRSILLQVVTTLDSNINNDLRKDSLDYIIQNNDIIDEYQRNEYGRCNHILLRCCVINLIQGNGLIHTEEWVLFSLKIDPLFLGNNLHITMINSLFKQYKQRVENGEIVDVDSIFALGFFQQIPKINSRDLVSIHQSVDDYIETLKEKDLYKKDDRNDLYHLIMSPLSTISDLDNMSTKNLYETMSFLRKGRHNHSKNNFPSYTEILWKRVLEENDFKSVHEIVREKTELIQLLNTVTLIDRNAIRFMSLTDSYNEWMTTLFLNIDLSLHGLLEKCSCCEKTWKEVIHELDDIEKIVDISDRNLRKLIQYRLLIQIPIVEKDLVFNEEIEMYEEIDMDDGIELGHFDSGEEAEVEEDDFI